MTRTLQYRRGALSPYHYPAIKSSATVNSPLTVNHCALQHARTSLGRWHGVVAALCQDLFEHRGAGEGVSLSLVMKSTGKHPLLPIYVGGRS